VYRPVLKNAYSPESEAQMRNFYGSLSEKDRRRYAAVEAAKLGYGGITYISFYLDGIMSLFLPGGISFRGYLILVPKSVQI
jgi:hypothetical protein